MTTVYEDPEAYQLAFSYRDFPAEVDAILSYLRRRGAGTARVLELAAGPADHALEFARRGIGATALDLSAAMVEYAAERARSAHLPLSAVQADMTDFELADKHDFALLCWTRLHIFTISTRSSAICNQLGAHCGRAEGTSSK